MKQKLDFNLTFVKENLPFPGLMIFSVGLSIFLTILMSTALRMPNIELSRPTGLPELEIGYVQQPNLNQAETETESEANIVHNQQPADNGSLTTEYLAYQSYTPGGSQASVVSTPNYSQCDQTAAQQAQDRWEADTAEEHVYHESQVEQINQIPNEEARTAALEQENARHQNRQSQIDNTYSQQLATANC